MYYNLYDDIEKCNDVLVDIFFIRFLKTLDEASKYNSAQNRINRFYFPKNIIFI